MGFALKKGGGYLSNVDATIVGYSFLVGDTSVMKKGDRKGEDFTPLSLVPEFQVDGATDSQEIRLLIGDAERFGNVSKDGLTLDTPGTPNGEAIYASSEAGIFLESLITPAEGDGFPVDQFADLDDATNLEAMIGTRVRLVRPVNAEKTAKQGKQVNANTGKSYDRTDLKVQRIYELPDGKVAKKGAATPVKGAKGKPQAASIDDTAQAALVRYLTDAPKQSLIVGKVRMKVLTDAAFKGDNDTRDAVVEYLLDTYNVAAMVKADLVTYDKKSGMITLT